MVLRLHSSCSSSTFHRRRTMRRRTGIIKGAHALCYLTPHCNASPARLLGLQYSAPFLQASARLRTMHGQVSVFISMACLPGVERVPPPCGAAFRAVGRYFVVSLAVMPGLAPAVLRSVVAHHKPDWFRRVCVEGGADMREGSARWLLHASL